MGRSAETKKRRRLKLRTVRRIAFCAQGIVSGAACATGGRDLLWPRPIFGQQVFPLWPRLTLGTTYFGHDLFWPRSHRLWPRSVLGIYEGEEGRGRAREWGGRGGKVGVVRNRGGNPNSEKGWGPEVRGLKGGGPKGAFLSFFLPHPFSFLFSLSWDLLVSFFFLWGSSRGILVVFLKTGALKCACFRPRVVVWKPPAACRRPKTLHEKTPRERKRHKRPPERKKDTRRHLERGKKTHEEIPRERMKMAAGEGKSAKFWAVRRRAVRRSGGLATKDRPSQSGWAKLAKVGLAVTKSILPSRSWPHLVRRSGGHGGLAAWPPKIGQAKAGGKVGQSWLGCDKDYFAKVGRGQSWSWPKWVVAKVGHGQSGSWPK